MPKKAAIPLCCSSEALSPLLWLQLWGSVPSPPGGMAQGRVYESPLLRGHALFSDGAHRKAFRESVRPGWEYLGRKMVGLPYLSGPWPRTHLTPHPSPLYSCSCFLALGQGGLCLNLRTFRLL